jgi:hypothetical protein
MEASMISDFRSTLPRFSRQSAACAILACAITVGLTSHAFAQGAANSFAVLSSSDVTLKNRVNISQVSVSAVTCPGSVGCPGDVGGTTVLMGRGNAAAPDTISGDVVASATSLQGLDCSGNPPGTTAICLGNDSEVAGACVTGGGAISSTSECANGADTTGQNSEVTTLLPAAQAAVVSYSATLAALPTTQSLSAIVVGKGGATISSTAALNVVSVPSITEGTNATLTLNGAATDTFVINVGNTTTPGSLQVGNGASVVLTGGITADRVIFNLIGTGSTAQLGNHTAFNGTILGPQGQFTSGDGDTPNPVLINGALLFGESISIGNNTNLSFYPFAGTSGNGNGSGSGSGSG